MLTLSSDTSKISLKDRMLIIEGAIEKDYWDLSTEDIKVEYAKGRLYIHTPASIKHEKIQGFLQFILNYYLDKNDLGEMLGSRVAVLLPSGKRPEPDLLYLEPGSYDMEKDIIFKGIPRWIIEILSKSTRNHDTGEKLTWYKEAKIEEIWLIDPVNQVLDVHRISKEGRYNQLSLGNGIIHPLDFKVDFEVSWLWELPKKTDLIRKI